jgi:hypothetical protein
MALVFVCHSKYDAEIVNFFSAELKAAGLNGILMEYEDTRRIYAGERMSEIIKDNRVACLIVIVNITDLA